MNSGKGKWKSLGLLKCKKGETQKTSVALIRWFKHKHARTNSQHYGLATLCFIPPTWFGFIKAFNTLLMFMLRPSSFSFLLFSWKYLKDCYKKPHISQISAVTVVSNHSHTEHHAVVLL